MKKSKFNIIFVVIVLFVSLTLNSCQEDVRVLRSEDPWLVYVSDRNGNNDVFAINPITKENIFLLGSDFKEGSLRYNPKENKIVVQRYEENNVMLVDNDSELFASPNKNSAPAWSIEGKMVYSAEKNGQYDLYVADADGNNITQLTNSSEREKDPAWDPTGNQVVYVKQVDNYWDLFIFNTSTGEEKRITETNRNISNPTWSPDGKRIAFDAVYYEQSEIAFVDIQSLEVTRVTQRSGDDTKPSWAPDSYTIAFESDYGEGDSNIWLVDIETKELNQFTKHPGFDGNPIFVPYSSIMDLVIK